MHYNLLFNGCSWTEGSELEGINKDYEFQRLHRFSHIVSQKTGLTYANISKGGSSNERILRSTVEWFEEGNTCDHAIIQWTNRWRVEYFSEKSLASWGKPLQYYSIFSKSSISSKSLLESFTHIQNNSNDQNDQDRCMYWMEQFLKNRCSFDYLKLRKQKEVSKEYYEKGTYYKHRTKFPISYLLGDILSESRDTEDYCFSYKNCNWLRGTHPSKLGHRKIADYIINNFQYFKVDAL